jgi:hypothetical protein
MTRSGKPHSARETATTFSGRSSYEVAAVALTLVGMATALAMTGQNVIIGRRAERRMKTEKKQWEVKQP